MSDILIKNMGMPKNCGECLFKHLSPTGESIVCELDLSTVSWESRPFDCPLIEVPSADVTEVRHGEWLPNKYIYDALDCSICGHFVYDEDIPNFCPNCGADMRGGT